ncbi:MAG: ATP synthase A1 subunit C [Methanoregula sp.]|jgi:V/A-type H+-transporting ATPase subunit C|nr:ATP synthase A1 subunit C [Methanoregula sp.]
MDYGYINARMRGMKSRLLSHSTLNDLVTRPDLDSLITDLENTPYRDEIIKAKGQMTGILCIEYALRENFTHTFRKIQNFAKQEEAEQYIVIFLHRWDVQNIKTILRGKNIHVTNEEILSCLVPAGEMDQATLQELLKQPDVRAVIDMLATWRIRYAKCLTEAFPEFFRIKDLAVLECALDRYYYTDAIDSVRVPGYNNQIIRDFIQLEIDVTNIKTVLRMIRDHVGPDDARRYLVGGGKEFDERKLNHMLTLPAIEDVVKYLAATPYRFLADIPESAIRTQRISVIEKQLERFLIKKGVGAFLLEPLSVASVIGYFWAKYNEITNIRIISRCKTADVSPDLLKEELIYV